MPDLYTHGDIRDRIAQHYSGGIPRFLHDQGCAEEMNSRSVRLAQRRMLAKQRGRRSRLVIAKMARCAITGRWLPKT